MYSRLGQVKFVEDIYEKIWTDADHITSNFLNAVFHKYLDPNGLAKSKWQWLDYPGLLQKVVEAVVRYLFDYFISFCQ